MKEGNANKMTNFKSWYTHNIACITLTQLHPFPLQDRDTVADDDFDWLRNNGQTSTGGTGPDTDHTFGTAAGYYAYADATNQATGNQAFLMSETFPFNTEMCVSFWYHMNGDHIGSLGKWVMLRI